MTTPAPPIPDLREAVAAVRERIAAACARAGRDPAEITLIAASKTRAERDIQAALRAGISDFGENYVQEGVEKFAGFEPGSITRHFIGHLQRNKVNAAVDAFDVFHGIDSERTLHALGHRATRSVPVFIQVNLAGEPSKSGVAPGALTDLIDAARALQSTSLLGLMTVPPAGTPEAARPWFAQLRELAHHHGLRHLSMGMTDDFDQAIEEGATHIRVGRAIFGERTS